mmetsp:Transcript_31313/g.32492  ORF Transcript_31313/g.32492 Transcript_31313/m.32492 type:complete len:193 (+) Transcript_31313:12-590(+)
MNHLTFLLILLPLTLQRTTKFQRIQYLGTDASKGHHIRFAWSVDDGGLPNHDAVDSNYLLSLKRSDTNPEIAVDGSLLSTDLTPVYKTFLPSIIGQGPFHYVASEITEVPCDGTAGTNFVTSFLDMYVKYFYCEDEARDYYEARIASDGTELAIRYSSATQSFPQQNGYLYDNVNNMVDIMKGDGMIKGCSL